MKATLSLLLADLPARPMANCGNAVLAAIPVTVLRKVLRLMKGVVRGDGMRIISLRVRLF
jgi:hypothetical protein